MPLYVVATPVGNLEDITRRAARVLSSCDLILAEDTRRTRVLLQAIGAATPMRAYHEHSSESATARVVEELSAGKSIALVSDAGTPCISDPGFELVRAAVAAGIEVVTVPGPSSVLAFVAASGLPCDRFQFVGFAPRSDGARREAVDAWLRYPGTTIAFESPNRVVGLARTIAEVDPERSVCVARELTKLHEEWIRGTSSQVFEALDARDKVRGEVVVGLAPGSEAAAGTAEVERLLVDLLEAGVKTKQAAAIAARHLGCNARDAYALALELRR